MKADYGLDAPNVVRNFFFLSLLSLLLAVLTFFIQSPVWFWLAFTYCLFYVVLFPLFGFGMYYSSRFIKPKIILGIIDDLNLQGHEKILDLGCGRGLVLNTAAKKLTDGKVFGIDLWKSVDQSGNTPDATLKNAQIEGVAEKIEILTADMQKLPFSDSTFDIIISSLAIHNIPTGDGRNRALTELLRVLKPGGTFVILDMRYSKIYAQFFTESGIAGIQRNKLKSFYFPPLSIVKGSKNPKID